MDTAADASSLPLAAWAGDMAIYVVGVALAAALIFAARLLLRRDEVGKTRVPLLLVIGHVLLLVAAIATADWPAPHRVLRTAASFLLLLALGRIGFVLAVDAVLGRRPGRPIPKIFRDICEGLVYGGVVLVTLRQAGAQLDALLTTSALLTAVIGLSLQDTLGNLFAGLSIQAQNPFEVGDWIQYGEDERTLGRVIEINWRATKVLTLDAVEVVIPNGQLARAPIRNFTRPTSISRRSIPVVVPFHVSPHRVHTVLLGALRQVEGVLSDPPPAILTSGFEERGIRYRVVFFIGDFARREQIDSLVRDRIWFAAHREEVPFATPVGVVHLQREDETARAQHRAEALSRRKDALRRVDFLRVLSDEQVATLAHYSVERLYAGGEMILRQGEAGDEFFILQRGEVAVLLGPEAVEVARLSTGEFFGEMSILTGAPRRASVRAVSDTEVLVVGKDGMKHVLAASPELAEQISDALASRQEELDSARSRTSVTVTERRVVERRELLGRIKEFFSLT